MHFEKIDRNNNFNLIRLFAACQVAITHSAYHLKVTLPGFFNFLEFFPGVPIFFTVSGFLITNSLAVRPNLKEYFVKRILRIYPALWICLGVTVCLLFYFDVLNISNVFSIQFFVWLITQLSFMQFYTPDMLRSWGVGTPNGSLWTIPVELQFYIILPLLMWTIIRLKKIHSILIISGCILISLYINQIFPHLNDDLLSVKLLHVSILPYFNYFLLGGILYIFWSNVQYCIKNKFFIWISIYILYILIFHYFFQWFGPSYYPNALGWLANILLSVVVISFAFSFRTLSDRLSKGYDLSYGIYIYHMVIVNTVLSLNIGEYRLLYSLCTTLVFAFGSWVIIEAPCLKMKSRFILSDLPKHA